MHYFLKAVFYSVNVGSLVKLAVDVKYARNHGKEAHAHTAPYRNYYHYRHKIFGGLQPLYGLRDYAPVQKIGVYGTHAVAREDNLPHDGHGCARRHGGRIDYQRKHGSGTSGNLRQHPREEEGQKVSHRARDYRKLERVGHDVLHEHRVLSKQIYIVVQSHPLRKRNGVEVGKRKIYRHQYGKHYEHRESEQVRKQKNIVAYRFLTNP